MRVQADSLPFPPVSQVECPCGGQLHDCVGLKELSLFATKSVMSQCSCLESWCMVGAYLPVRMQIGPVLTG